MRNTRYSSPHLSRLVTPESVEGDISCHMKILPFQRVSTQMSRLVLRPADFRSIRSLFLSDWPFISLVSRMEHTAYWWELFPAFYIWSWTTKSLLIGRCTIKFKYLTDWHPSLSAKNLPFSIHGISRNGNNYSAARARLIGLNFSPVNFLAIGQEFHGPVSKSVAICYRHPLGTLLNIQYKLGLEKGFQSAYQTRESVSAVCWLQASITKACLRRLT